MLCTAHASNERSKRGAQARSRSLPGWCAVRARAHAAVHRATAGARARCVQQRCTPARVPKPTWHLPIKVQLQEVPEGLRLVVLCQGHHVALPAGRQARWPQGAGRASSSAAWGSAPIRPCTHARTHARRLHCMRVVSRRGARGTATPRTSRRQSTLPGMFCTAPGARRTCQSGARACAGTQQRRAGRAMLHVRVHRARPPRCMAHARPCILHNPTHRPRKEFTLKLPSGSGGYLCRKAGRSRPRRSLGHVKMERRCADVPGVLCCACG